MLESSRIPNKNPGLEGMMQKKISDAKGANEVTSTIEKKLSKIENLISDKINKAITISEYLNSLWNAEEMKDSCKDYAIIQVEKYNIGVKEMLMEGEQRFGSVPGDLDEINEKKKITDYEQFNMAEKVQDILKKDWEVVHRLPNAENNDLNVMRSLCRPFNFKNINSVSTDYFHYGQGLVFVDKDEDVRAEAEKMMERIKKERKDYLLRRKVNKEANLMKERSDLEFIAEQQKTADEKKMKKRKEDFDSKMQEIQDRDKERERMKILWEKQKEEYQRPVYKLIGDHEKAERQKEAQAIDEKLKQLRASHKPLDKSDFEKWEQEHKLHFDEVHNKRNPLHDQANWKMKNPHFKHNLHHVVSEEMLNNKKQNLIEFEKRKEQRQKIRDYQIKVKEEFLPQLNTEESTTNKKQKAKDEVDPFLGRKCGNKYLEELRDLPKKAPSKNQSEIERTQLENVTMRSEERRKDYLQEIRNAGLLRSQDDSVQKIIHNSNLNKKERQVLLLAETEKMEAKMKRIQQLKKYGHASQQNLNKSVKSDKDNTLASDDDEQLDNLYIQSIKAKLRILKDQN